MNPADRYPKIVEWSEEDQCFVGSCPGLFYGGWHGDDERAVFEELCEIVSETVALYEREGKPLPPATSGVDWANAMAKVMSSG
jgi:predicted RNase H-like HicB family nuclease